MRSSGGNAGQAATISRSAASPFDALCLLRAVWETSDSRNVDCVGWRSPDRSCVRSCVSPDSGDAQRAARPSPAMRSDRTASNRAVTTRFHRGARRGRWFCGGRTHCHISPRRRFRRLKAANSLGDVRRFKSGRDQKNSGRERDRHDRGGQTGSAHVHFRCARAAGGAQNRERTSAERRGAGVGERADGLRIGGAEGA